MRSQVACLRVPLLASSMLLLAAIGTPSCSETPPPGPNLLLVTIDSLRAGRLACYGGADDLGTALCSVADPGVLYVWAISAAPSGAAAATSILTSLPPSRHGVGDSAETFLPSAVETLPEWLTAAGYRTGAVVSSPELGRVRNLHQGFARFDDRLERRPDQAPERDARTTTDAAVAWLESVEPPWLLWVHYGDLHGPYPPPPIPNYEQYEERYRQRLRALDAEFARLLQAAAAHGERLGIAVMGTHGEAIGENGQWFRHGHSLGLEQIRVPLLWRPPDAARAERIAVAVSALDVAPTLLRAAGAHARPAVEGAALPRAGDPPSGPERPRAVFAEREGSIAVVSGGHFYTRDGRLPRLGARIARLGDDGRLPEAGPATAPSLRARVDRLEARIEEHLRASEEDTAR